MADGPCNGLRCVPRTHVRYLHRQGMACPFDMFALAQGRARCCNIPVPRGSTLVLVLVLVLVLAQPLACIRAGVDTVRHLVCRPRPLYSTVRASLVPAAVDLVGQHSMIRLPRWSSAPLGLPLFQKEDDGPRPYVCTYRAVSAIGTPRTVGPNGGLD